MFDFIQKRRIKKQVVPDVNVPKMRKRFQRLGDAEAITMLEAFSYLRDQATDVVLADRKRLIAALKYTQGEKGPDAWGRGYYDGADDAIDIVKKGK